MVTLTIFKISSDVSHLEYLIRLAKLTAVHRQGMTDAATGFHVGRCSAGTNGLVCDQTHEELKSVRAVFLYFY